MRILLLLLFPFFALAQIQAVTSVANRGTTPQVEENPFAAQVMGISSGTFSSDVTNTRFIRYMQPIVNPTKDAGALDSSQSWLLDIIDTGSEWRMFYTGANTQTLNYTPDGQDYTNNDATFMAIKTKSNDVIDGWNKVLDVNGDPKPIFKPSFINGRFDEWQVWIRTIINDGGGNLRGWYIGDNGSPQFEYRVGYATSTDNGDTWTRLGTTPIYTDLLTDPGRGIVCLRVVYNPDTEKYVMLYGGIYMNVDGFKVAQSDDGITGWSVTHSGLFANLDYLAPSDFKYIDGVYYLWVQANQMMPAGNLGPARDVIVFSSTDLITWTNLGVQLTIRGAQEFGIGNHVKAMQKPNGNWFIAHTWYMNRTQAIDNLNATKEPSPATKISDSNDDSFIKNSANHYLYPSYVKFHAPLSYELQFTDVVNEVSGSINSPAVWYSDRDFLKLNGSQTVTMPNEPDVIDGGDFALKIRVQTVTTGTHTLLKIGNDIWWTLENGKQRIRVSSDGVTYQKDYIATVNIGKPAGLDYIDDHVYIAISCINGVIRVWNEDCVTEITGSMTETVDNALTTVNDSEADILIGQNATLNLRSVSILDEHTVTELTELDI